MSKGLKYVGKGNFLPGVPARDLTEAEAMYHGRETLIKSGLYVPKQDKPGPSETKAKKKDK